MFLFKLQKRVAARIVMVLALLILAAPVIWADNMVVIRADAPQTAPEWALMERHLIDTMNRAGVDFFRTYVQPDGTLRWKERYEGGMNSSDDAYEGFRGFSLHYILGGSRELDRLHRHVWEGITQQFTRYGQIYREFDSHWDWMHHGEGYVSLYPMGMADPYDDKFRDRAVRFAAMYIGEDPEAPNYNPGLKLMRASMTGSRGPKMEWTKRDWIPTNANLVYYHLPFDDIPGVKTSTGWINDHPENDQFARIVQVMSDRMAKGDVPINLTSTALVMNAFLYTGAEKYRQWVRDYLGKWVELTKENNGITPDNVGINGKVGEHTNGNWWGGYYGWKWVGGGNHMLRATATAAKVAVALTGEPHWMELPRGQMARMRERGKVQNGVAVMPMRYDNANQWHHYQPEPAVHYVHFWHVSQSQEDWKQIERLAELEKKKGGLRDPDLGWAYFVKGRNPSYPIEAFQRSLRFIRQRMELILNEHGDPETWFDGKWMRVEPLPTDDLVRLTIGGLPVHKVGEILHSYVRYFDPDRHAPGLPLDVAALVTGLSDDSVEIELVNTNVFERRRMIIQGGAYGEHRLTTVTYRATKEVQPPNKSWLPDEPVTENRTVPVGGQYFQVDLGPGAGTTLRIGLERYANSPRYAFPWKDREGIR